MDQHKVDNVVDLVAALVREHREVDAMLTRLLALPRDQARQRGELAHEIMFLLIRHAVAEETCLYPALRSRVLGGDVIADQALTAHDAIQRIGGQLEKVAPHEPRFDELVKQAQSQLREHVADEEARVFPLLAQHIPAAELQRLHERAHERRT